MKAKKTISIPKLKAKALKLYTDYFKLRAASEDKLYCFTCDSPLELKTTNCQLGHFLPRGAYPAMTFEVDNTRLQCYRCNVMLHGNTFEFRERLIKEIGITKVEFMEANRHSQIKWCRSDLQEMITNFNEAIRELEKNT